VHIHKKSLFNRSAEEARELLVAYGDQARTVASSERAQYHRHANTHTPAVGSTFVTVATGLSLMLEEEAPKA
jgi:hypothetical protein